MRLTANYKLWKKRSVTEIKMQHKEKRLEKVNRASMTYETIKRCKTYTSSHKKQDNRKKNSNNG